MDVKQRPAFGADRCFIVGLWKRGGELLFLLYDNREIGGEGYGCAYGGIDG